MQPYPTNSPQAAASIVALAMLADGGICMAEVGVLDRLDAHAQLGLETEQFHVVVHDCWKELLSAAQLTWADACQVDPRSLAERMAEIADPGLRRTVLCLCVAVIEADGRVAEGESVVLGAALALWGLQPASLSSRRGGPGGLSCPRTSTWDDEHQPPDLLIGASPRQMVRHCPKG
jgi:hypothetical protein